VLSSSTPTNFGEQYAIRNGDIISPNVGLSEPLKEQCLHFVNCIQRHERPLSDGQNGRDVVRVMVAIEESVKRKGAPVELILEGEHDDNSKAVADLVR